MAPTSMRTPDAVAVGLIATLLFLVVAPAQAESSGVCTKTAQHQNRACMSGVSEDYHTTRAFCLNAPDEVDECLGEAREARSEGKQECHEQTQARRELCEEIGEAPYDPEIDPVDFQDPRNLANPNMHFPLAVGNQWVYAEDGERIEITILDATKRVEGVDCIVYRDIVTDEGLLVEDTDDWFAIKNNGDVIYCGEEVKDFAYFVGDDPEEPELIEIDGRFKAGVDLAKSGTIFFGNPVVGTTYRQEWDPGNAEDIGTVLATDYAYGNDEELDELVPQELAELMCGNADCVVIADRSTLDPGAFERKYYAKGIGKFLETKPEDGEFVPLVECNFEPRCDDLPIEDEEEEE